MNVTPEYVDLLRDGTIPGPWLVHTDPIDVEETYIYSDDGRMCISVAPQGSTYSIHDLNLAAAAPDMAATIADMTWEWRIEKWNGTHWIPCGEWDADAPVSDGHTMRRGERLVRHLVGSVEVVAGE